MRKIVSNFFITLDGVVESPDKWSFPYFSDEIGQAIGKGMAASDAILLGRVTYTDWASYWPTSQDQPMADQLNGIKKYVVSTTLDTVDWNNSELVKGDLAEEIAKLKQLPGKDIAMSGSGILAEWLLHAGLVDELHLLVNPIVVGEGRRLFTSSKPARPLKLVSSDTFSTGVVHLTYDTSGS